MTCDEVFYRQYLSGDDAGLEALMKKYGDPLTLYIDGYLHDVHEAEELMLDVFAYLFTKKPKIRDGGFKAYLYKAARHTALRRKSSAKRSFCCTSGYFSRSTGLRNMASGRIHRLPSP